MKVLQVNCVYKTGSTGKIVADIHAELQQRGWQPLAAYGRGPLVPDSGVHRTGNDFLGKINNACSRVTGILYGGCWLETWRLLRLIHREQPDVVHLHCLNGFFVNIYGLLRWLGKGQYKVVLTQHAEFMYTGSCGYALDCNAWKETGCSQCPCWRTETRSLTGDRTAIAWRRMKKAVACMAPRNFQAVSVSSWLMERAAQSVILKDYPHSVVLNGVDTGVFTRRERPREEICPEAQGKVIVFHATAMFSSAPEHMKGGYYLLELARRMQDRPVHFYVAGTCEKGISVPDNVTLLGRIEDQEALAAYYSQADVTLLTSKRETFSMVCAESLCCGTPVVGFCAGAPETIAMPQYSCFVEFGDTDRLEAALQEMLDRKLSKDKISAEAGAVYSKQRMAEEYCRIYEALCADGR